MVSAHERTPERSTSLRTRSAVARQRRPAPMVIVRGALAASASRLSELLRCARFFDRCDERPVSKLGNISTAGEDARSPNTSSGALAIAPFEGAPTAAASSSLHYICATSLERCRFLLLFDRCLSCAI